MGGEKRAVFAKSDPAKGRKGGPMYVIYQRIPVNSYVEKNKEERNAW